MDLDEEKDNLEFEWEQYKDSCEYGDYLNTGLSVEFACVVPTRNVDQADAPYPRGLSISTISKSLRLNHTINTPELFWKIPVIPYTDYRCGVVKKQLYVRSTTPQQVEEYNEQRSKLNNCEFPIHEIIVQHIDTPKASHVQYLDKRSIAIGTCRKNIISPKKRKRCAFSNCTVLYVRYLYLGRYYETHVKLFDDGAIEATGMSVNERMDPLKETLLEILQECYPDLDIHFDDECRDVCVLINSGFSCNFSVDQTALSALLNSSQYQIFNTLTLGYPALNCKYFYDTSKPCHEQDGRIRASDIGMEFKLLKAAPWYIIISFMVFSTGEVLISGNASEEIIRFVHAFVRDLMRTHYSEIINLNGSGPRPGRARVVQPRLRISVSRTFFAANCNTRLTGKRSLEASDNSNGSPDDPQYKFARKLKRLKKRRALAAIARKERHRKNQFAIAPSAVFCNVPAEVDEKSKRFFSKFRRCDVSQLPPTVEKKSHKKQLPIVPVETVERLSRFMVGWLQQ